VASGAVAGGTASATYVLPGGTSAATYTIRRSIAGQPPGRRLSHQQRPSGTHT
jgi:hypothetical protein